MSDFDKEAERERLREKYERDQQKREATERMSDLLLKGATMTNAHCDTCGDPIFRYDGQEFCPTCEEVVTEDLSAAQDSPEQRDVADSEGDATASGEGAGAAERADADSPAQRSNADEAGLAERDGATTEDGTAELADAEPIEVNPTRDQPDSGATSETGVGPDEPSGTASPPTGAGRGDPDIAAARESLVRTLVEQARAAEQCEEPRRARDHLAAAREAADAIAALSY